MKCLRCGAGSEWIEVKARKPYSKKLAKALKMQKTKKPVSKEKLLATSRDDRV